MSNKTVKNNVLSMLNKIEACTIELLEKHSSVKSVNDCFSSIVIINPYGDHSWSDLPAEGKQLQVKTLELYTKFNDIVSLLLQVLPKNATRKSKESLERLKRYITQDNSTWSATIPAAIEDLQKHTATIKGLLNEYYGSDTDKVYLVPDTNVLILNPAIEKWWVDDIDRFCVVLTPTVLAELDNHKINHRNSEVRDKAKKIIGQIKEYRRRGILSDGVSIVKGKIDLMAITTEPDMNNSLPWLDSSNADDKLLASVLEVMRGYLNSTVMLLTEDINVQNKAELACIPYVELGC